MDDENSFYLQLAKTIQSWLWVEAELYSLYLMLMNGANGHLVSVTFNSIQSVEIKLNLLNYCFNLVFSENDKERKNWKTLFNKIEKLNKKRNKIVHEPVSFSTEKGIATVYIGPSYSNALALSKGQTSHKNGPVISAEYVPKNAKLLDNHKIYLAGLVNLENSFISISRELHEFREQIYTKVVFYLKSADNKR